MGRLSQQTPSGMDFARPCRTCRKMQPYSEYTICRGHPKASCKACRARIQGRYYRENTAARLQNGQRSRLRAAQLAQGVRPFRNLFWYVGCSPSSLCPTSKRCFRLLGRGRTMGKCGNATIFYLCVLLTSRVPSSCIVSPITQTSSHFHFGRTSLRGHALHHALF